MKNIFRKFQNDYPNVAEQAFRRCGYDGKWLDSNKLSSPIGWTDFLNCFPPIFQTLLGDISDPDHKLFDKISVAEYVRDSEIFGLICSAVMLSTAIVVFSWNRVLLNRRTRIHRHLLSILLLQVTTSLCMYIDQANFHFLERNGITCVTLYCLFELLTSISFTFMLIEGFMLHSVVSTSALQEQVPYRHLIAFGYLFPTTNTIIWILVGSFYYETAACWFGYNLGPIYWIVHGPRLIILMTNLYFMGKVHVIVWRKMPRSTSIVKRIRKMLRMAFILMPLLGITNFVSLTNPPLTDTTVNFAIWAFVAFFLRSLQGVLVAVVYCFMNQEVIDVLKRKRKARRQKNQAFRTQPYPIAEEDGPENIEMVEIISQRRLNALSYIDDSECSAGETQQQNTELDDIIVAF